MTKVNRHNQNNLLKMGVQIYCAGQWAEAGVYRCLDPCSANERVVTLEADGFCERPIHSERWHEIIKKPTPKPKPER